MILNNKNLKDLLILKRFGCSELLNNIGFIGLSDFIAFKCIYYGVMPLSAVKRIILIQFTVPKATEN